MTLIRAIGDDSRFMFSWTEQSVAQLRRLAAAKLSASEIAKDIGGGLTRSAVLGKAHRIGVKIDSGARGLARPKGRGEEPKPVSEVRRTPRLPPFPGARVNGSGKHAPDCRAGEGGASRHTTRRSGDVGTAAAVERSAVALKPAPRTKLKSDGTLASYFAPTQPKLRAEPVDAQPIRVTITELTAEHCRWPLGDASDLDTFRYCGARVDLPGVLPYCAGHCRMAYARAA